MRFKYKHLIYLVIWVLIIIFGKFNSIIMIDLPKNDFNSHNPLTEKNKKMLSEILANDELQIISAKTKLKKIIEEDKIQTEEYRKKLLEENPNLFNNQSITPKYQ